MSRYDDIDDARAALIDQRIGQSFEFLGDVIDDPRLLDAIPDGSRLAFRDVALGGFSFRLTADQHPDTRDRWIALVTGRHGAGSEGETESSRKPDASATGKTAALALDALELELREFLTIPA